MNKRLILAFGLVLLFASVVSIYFISAAVPSAPTGVHFENNFSSSLDDGVFSINWTAGDNSTTNYTIYKFREGTNLGLIGNNSRTGYSFSTTTEGNYSFIVAAINGWYPSNANSANSSNIFIYVDRTAPKVKNIYSTFFTNGTIKQNTDNLIFDVELADMSPIPYPYSGLTGSVCSVNVGGGANITSSVVPFGSGNFLGFNYQDGGCNNTLSLAGLSDGIYPINFYVNDSFSNLRFNNSAFVQIGNSTTPSSNTSNVTNNCYQETANVSTSCGGLSTGGYALAGNWAYTNGLRTYDGNWGTYDVVGDSNSSILYTNYTKPANALISSLWQISDAAITPVNLTITSACWNYNPNILSLRMISPPYNPGGISQCWDGNSWVTLRNYTSGTPGNGIYEEAMWWNPVATNSGTTTNNTTTTTTTSGGGGGGGGGSSTTTVTQTTNTTANHPIVLNVTNSSTGVTQVQITSNQSSTNASVSISQSNSTEVTTSAKTYQTFQIQLGGLDEINIINVSINFKVNKTWIGANNRDPANVTLYRNTGTDSSPIWTALATHLTNQDNNSYYYTSISPGFSTYSVVVGVVSCTANQFRCLVNDLQKCGENNQTWTTTKTCSNGCNQGACVGENVITRIFGSSVYYFAVALVVILVAVVSFIIVRNRKKISK